MNRRRGAAFAVAGLALLTFLHAPARAAVTERSGYLTMADGTQLRWTVDLPSATGRFPVAMNYDGYCAGSGARVCNDPELADALLAHGYAVLGVSIRGTACSSGSFDLLSRHQSEDGAAAVTWASKQPWSNGRVGMFGDSFPGLVQPPIAALRPPGLAAIAPFQIVDDVYRDVAYPGGVYDVGFAGFWGLADQPFSSETTIYRDPCVQSFASREPATTQQNIFLQTTQHPYDDAFYVTRRTEDAARRIAVPVLGCETWQDDEVGSRPSFDLFAHIRRDLLWLVASNGFHGQCDVGNPRVDALLIAFFDRYVKGTHNGFERTPRAQVWHETHFVTAPPPGGTGIVSLGADNPVTPSWVTTFSSWPPRTRPQALYLGAGGALASRRTGSGSAAYLSAAPGPAQEDGIVNGENHLWSRQPVVPGTGVAWTTSALTSDLELLGPASADLWMTSTGADTTVQVTLTEVRPDGQETYVARGWLRASHRRLDPRRSTVTRPYETHLEADAAPLVLNTPALLRVEVFPFDHVFRAGSRLRLIVDTPSTTGGWSFADPRDAAQNTVLFDRAYASRLVLPVLPGARALRPLPACGALLNQPCRSSAY